ncbi:MAG: myo-inositol-1(or 4)-monophosphatase [Parcubacteria group bacterium Athens0714_16]|nr:MAG: myo-inositol-1(or 4)-monophosphatase [Parcubacteria group bacterium Athens0714_16]
MNKNKYNFIISTIKQAGDILIDSREKYFSVSSKDGDSRNIITSVDLEVNNFLEKMIHSTYPDEIIFSEETEDVITTKTGFWSLDPIDGTSNFARNIPHFAVVISYIENNEPVVGAVYNPITRELFSFEKNIGAYLNEKKISVSDVSTLKESYILLHIGRSDDVREWGIKLQRILLGKAKKTINLGSSALDLCFLAAGRVDAVIYGTLTTKDIAAAIAIVREAGGEVYDISGIPVSINKEPQQIIATTNRELFKEISQLY